MKKHSTKQALLCAALALVLCVSMLVGTTFAWFTDSVTSANNKIVAGNLKLDLELLDAKTGVWSSIKESKAPLFNYEKWEPGYTEVKVLKVENEGTLALKWKAVFTPLEATTALAEVIDVYVKPSETDALTYPNGRDLGAQGYTKVGTLAQFIGSIQETTYGNLQAGGTAYLAIALQMQESAGNEYQKMKLGAFDITIVATQMTSESDSYGNDYDKDATFPSVAYTNYTDNTKPQTIDAGDAMLTIPAGAATGEYQFTASNKTVTTENGKTTLAFDLDLTKDGVKVQAGTSYTVSIKVGTGLDLEKVLHNGEPIASFEYDPTGEYVTFTTTSFSPFAVVYTAFPENAVYVSTAKELQDAVKANKPDTNVANGANATPIYIVLTDDLVFDSSAEFMNSSSKGVLVYVHRANVTLDLNGHNITATADAVMAGNSYTTALLAVNYSTFRLIGEGDIIIENKAIAVYGWSNSTVIVESGTFVSNAYERNESAVYCNNNNTTVHVYGGNYTDSAYAFNVHDTNCGNTTVLVLHEGITYAKFLKNGTIDVTASDINSGHIALAEGCELVTTEIDGITWYKVVAAN